MVVNFIFQITLTMTTLLNIVVVLIAIFIIHYLFFTISPKSAWILAPNKSVDDCCNILKFNFCGNEQITVLPSLLDKKTW